MNSQFSIASHRLFSALTFIGTICLLITVKVEAQSLNWAKSAGGAESDISEGIAIDNFGNSYVSGLFTDSATFGEAPNSVTLTSAGSRDIFIAKYSAEGDLVWAKSAGGAADDGAEGNAIDLVGNSYLTGCFQSEATFGEGSNTETLTSFGENDIFVAKYDSTGALLWAKSAGGPDVEDNGADVGVDGLGNCYVFGRFDEYATFGEGADTLTLFSHGDDDVFLAKYDGDGNLIWVRQAGSTSGEDAHSIAVDIAGNCYVVGSFGIPMLFIEDGDTLELSSKGSTDMFLAKYDTDGSFLWAKSAGGSDLESGLDVHLDNIGNCYVTGGFRDVATFGEGVDSLTLTSVGNFDVFLAKYDSDGNLIWAKAAGGVEDDLGRGVRVDTIGNSYITGSFGAPSGASATFGEGASSITLPNAGANDIFLAKYDLDGNLEWAKQAGGPDSDAAHDIGLDGLNNTYISGDYRVTATFGEGANSVTLNSVNGSREAFVAKYEAGIPCSDILGFRTKCLGSQKIGIRMRLFSPDYEGEEVSFTIDGLDTLDGFVVNGRVLILSPNTYGPGAHSVELIDPPNCLIAETVTCGSSQLPSAVELQNNQSLPTEYALHQNYPNPFNPSTIIDYSLPIESWVTIKIYDALGREVLELVHRYESAGQKSITWNGKNQAGHSVTSGMYIVKMNVGEFVDVIKIVLSP